MYSLRGVSKQFHQGSATINAVDSVDVDIAAGEFLVVQGSSGSGKTTLLQLLGGLDRATDGVVSFEEQDLGALGDRALADLRLRAFGFVFQQFNLIPTLTALENVEAAIAPTKPSRESRRARAEEVLSEVGLAERAKHLPSQLSGGEQQRVAIARALANSPRVILADEPTGNLDSSTGRDVVQLLARLSSEHGQTVVLVTHDESLAALATRAVRMQDGRVLEPDPEPELAVAAPARRRPSTPRKPRTTPRVRPAPSVETE